MADFDPRGLEILHAAECRRLLRAGGIGRLGWVVDGLPVIRPVNFALDDERIVIRTGEGGVHSAARAAQPATFEVDSTHNIDHTAWSVIVDGTIELTDDDEARRMPLRSWAPVGSDHFVQLSITEISGRRIGEPR